jgi:hypothetical protein
MDSSDRAPNRNSIGSLGSGVISRGYRFSKLPPDKVFRVCSLERLSITFPFSHKVQEIHSIFEFLLGKELAIADDIRVSESRVDRGFPTVTEEG